MWIDPSFELGLAADFEQRLRAAVAAAGADVPVAVGPALQRPRGSDLRFADELFGRIHDDLDSADPLVFMYLTPGRWPGVWCYAYRRQGTSGRLVGPGELELLRGDFRQDPGPFVEYCAAVGRAWLGEGADPEVADYIDRRFEPGDPAFFEL